MPAKIMPGRKTAEHDVILENLSKEVRQLSAEGLGPVGLLQLD